MCTLLSGYLMKRINVPVNEEEDNDDDSRMLKSSTKQQHEQCI